MAGLFNDRFSAVTASTLVSANTVIANTIITRRKVLHINAETTLSAIDSGAIIYCEAPTIAITIYLPLASTSTGVHYHFVYEKPSEDISIRISTLDPDTPVTNHVVGTLSCNNGVSSGALQPNRITLPGGNYIAVKMPKTPSPGALPGDNLSFNCDGTKWWVNGTCSSKNGFHRIVP